MPVRRGEIYWIDWDPARGSEQAYTGTEGRRRGLVVSNDIANEHAPVIIVAAMTTRQPSRPYPFVVSLSAAQTGLARDGAVNCLQLMTIARDRPSATSGRSPRPAGRVPSERMEDVDQALKAALSLT
jgi:mRNA interferase MazF